MAVRRKKIKFPALGDFEVRVLLSSNVKATSRALHSNAEGDEACCITESEKPGMCWLVFGELPTIDHVAHEAYHAVVAMLQFTGAKREEEVVAHHLGYLVQQIFDFTRVSKVLTVKLGYCKHDPNGAHNSLHAKRADCDEWRSV